VNPIEESKKVKKDNSKKVYFYDLDASKYITFHPRGATHQSPTVKSKEPYDRTFMVGDVVYSNHNGEVKAYEVKLMARELQLKTNQRFLSKVIFLRGISLTGNPSKGLVISALEELTRIQG